MSDVHDVDSALFTIKQDNGDLQALGKHALTDDAATTSSLKPARTMSDVPGLQEPAGDAMQALEDHEVEYLPLAISLDNTDSGDASRSRNTASSGDSSYSGKNWNTPLPNTTAAITTSEAAAMDLVSVTYLGEGTRSGSVPAVSGGAPLSGDHAFSGLTTHSSELPKDATDTTALGDLDKGTATCGRPDDSTSVMIAGNAPMLDNARVEAISVPSGETTRDAHAGLARDAIICHGDGDSGHLQAANSDKNSAPTQQTTNAAVADPL